MSYTITKAAEELNVSRTKIYSLIKKLSIETKKVSKENLISDNDFKKLEEIILNEQYELNEENNTNQTNQTTSRMKNVIDRDRNNIYGNISDREYTDLKERIKQLESQIDRKDQQIKEQSEQLIESLKANSSLVESNKELSIINSKLNLMSINPPINESSLESAIDKEEEPSWFKKLFKKHT